MIAELMPYPAMKDSGATIAAFPCREVWRGPQQAGNDRGVEAATLCCYEAPPT